MTLPDGFLLCFSLGALWSIASLMLGGMHLGHSHFGHFHASAGHAHAHGHSHSGHLHSSWLSSLVHPSSLAAFFAWFGGIGYLLTRHTGWHLWADLMVAIAAGLGGAFVLGSFLRFLQSREQPLNPLDYQMVGVLGKVACPIRQDGVGEVIYVRDGARRPVPARSEDGIPIGRGEEVIVTRYAGGIAYVRTWAAMMSQSPASGSEGKALPEETNRVK